MPSRSNLQDVRQGSAQARVDDRSEFAAERLERHHTRFHRESLQGGTETWHRTADGQWQTNASIPGRASRKVGTERRVNQWGTLYGVNIAVDKDSCGLQKIDIHSCQESLHSSGGQKQTDSAPASSSSYTNQYGIPSGVNLFGVDKAEDSGSNHEVAKIAGDES